MFFYLYNSVFPLLGDFFGRLSALASTDFTSVLVHCLPAPSDSVRIAIDYVNVFTGVSSSMAPFLNSALPSGTFLFYPLRSFVWVLFNIFGLTTLPFWIAILLFAVSILLAVAIVVFIKNLFT